MRETAEGGQEELSSSILKKLDKWNQPTPTSRESTLQYEDVHSRATPHIAKRMTQYSMQCNAQTSHRRESTLQYEGNSGSKRNAQWRARYYHRTPALCCSKSKEEITIQRHFDCPLTTQQKKYKCRVQLLLQAYTAQALLTHNIEFLASPLPQAAQ